MYSVMTHFHLHMYCLTTHSTTANIQIFKTSLQKTTCQDVLKHIPLQRSLFTLWSWRHIAVSLKLKLDKKEFLAGLYVRLQKITCLTTKNTIKGVIQIQ